MDAKDIIALAINGGTGVLVALALWKVTPAIFRELIAVLRDLAASIKDLAGQQAHTGTRLARIEAKLDISDDSEPAPRAVGTRDLTPTATVIR